MRAVGSSTRRQGYTAGMYQAASLQPSLTEARLHFSNFARPAFDFFALDQTRLLVRIVPQARLGEFQPSSVPVSAPTQTRASESSGAACRLSFDDSKAPIDRAHRGFSKSGRALSEVRKGFGRALYPSVEPQCPTRVEGSRFARDAHSPRVCDDGEMALGCSASLSGVRTYTNRWTTHRRDRPPR
jgi:hypothetical protein